MDFTYQAWGSGEIIVQAFRALAIIAASGELASSLQVAALLGILIVAAGAAFNLSHVSILAPVRIMIVMLLIGGVLLVPSRVTVTDSFDGQDLLLPGSRAVTGPVVVNGVPVGVAMPAAVASLIGSSLTRVIETATGRVDAEDRLSSAGLWLGARALRAMALDAEVSDPTLSGDFRYFLENCTYFDVLAERVSLEDLRGGSAMQELARTAGGLTSVHVEGEGLVLVSCTDAWAGNTSLGGIAVPGLEERIRAEGVARKFSACNSLRGIALAMDNAELAWAMRDARDPLTGPSATCGDGVFAHAMAEFGFTGSVADQFSQLVAIGLLREGVHTLSAQDPQAVALGRFTAERQRNATYVIAGELAAVALPALRGLLEAAVTVLLPVMLVMGLLFFDQFARYLANGLALLLWLQLWPPVMAVFNGIGQFVQVAAMNEHVILSNGTFTAAGIEGALAELDTQLAMSRYMLVMVPVVAWALVRAGEFSGSMLAARLMQPGEQAAGSVAGSVATNNWTMDQVQLAPRTAVGPHVATVGDPWGGTVTRYEQLSTMSMPSNEPGYLSATQSRTVTEALRRTSEESRMEQQQASTRFSRSVENAYESAFGTQGVETLATLREQGVSDTTSFRALQGTGEVMRQSEGKARSAGQSAGTEHVWRTGVGAGLNTSFVGFVTSFGADIDSSQYQKAGVSEDMRESYNQLDESTRSAIEEVGTALQGSERVSASASQSRITSDTHRAAMSEATSDMQSYEQAERRASRMALASEQAQGSGQAVVRELARDPHNAALLAEMHRLHIVEGKPFDQAWAEAQEASGVRLDIDAVATRLLGEEIAPMPSAARAPEDRIREGAENRRRVEAISRQAPGEPAELAEGRERIEAERQRVEGDEMPEAGEGHFDKDDVIYRETTDEDGRRMVVQSESLWRAGDKRMTEILSDTLGFGGDDEGKPAEKGEDKQ